MPQFVFKHKKIVEQLYSPKEELALDAIKTLRDTGDPSVVPYIADLYISTENQKIESALENFLKDIKDQAAAKAIVDVIQNPKSQKKITQLVGICWQTSINFGSYIDVFVDIAIKHDYQTCIEAFTVIEEALPYAAPKKINAEIDKLKEILPAIESDKKILLKELVITLQSYAG